MLKLRIRSLVPMIAVGGASPAVTFRWWTQNSHFESFDPSTDPIIASTFYHCYNPHQNPTFHDLCVRRTPISSLDSGLVKDYENGGSMLIETFSAALWGSWPYKIQRTYLQFYYRSPDTAHQLWTRADFLKSKYDVGTEITDHFVVLVKTPSSILLRCGDSPRNTPHGPRNVDGLFEISLKLHQDQGLAEFRLKSFFYYGTVKTETRPISPTSVEGWLHRKYAKLLMESGLRGCAK